MIDKLKYLMDSYKDNPKMLKLLTPLCSMSEKSQEASLQIIELVLEAKNE